MEQGAVGQGEEEQEGNALRSRAARRPSERFVIRIRFLRTVLSHARGVVWIVGGLSIAATKVPSRLIAS